MLSCGSAKPCGRRPKSTSAPPYVAEKQFYQQPNYYSVAANTTGRMVQLAAGATPPAWDALQRGLGELRGALSEDLSRFFRDEARWAPSEARQELGARGNHRGC
jgi:hypothetical protein